MITKEATARHLIGLKYDAKVKDGVVIILTDKPLHRGQKERLRNELRAVGYRGSWGWRQRGVTTE